MMNIIEKKSSIEEKLLLVDEMVKNSKNIPEELKGYVAAICKGYIRNSNGMISLKGVENVCNAKFIKINENDYLDFIRDNNFNNIFPFIDVTLESLWMLKKYENIERDEDFNFLSSIYFENKKKLLMVADILAEDYDRKEQIVKLYDAFADMSKFASTLPFNDEELKAFNFEGSTFGKLVITDEISCWIR